MTVEPFWTEVNEPALRQGDYLPRCLVPLFGAAFDAVSAAVTPHEMTAGESDLIIVTQSCDLEQRRSRLVAGCPIYPIGEFEAVNAAFARKGRWNEVLKGRVEGLHLLHWVIVGGESGHGARPMAKDWVLAIRDQCRAASVPFFFKQWGGVRKSKAGRELDGHDLRRPPQPSRQSGHADEPAAHRDRRLRGQVFRGHGRLQPRIGFHAKPQRARQESAKKAKKSEITPITRMDGVRLPGATYSSMYSALLKPLSGCYDHGWVNIPTHGRDLVGGHHGASWPCEERRGRARRASRFA
jgi:Protein of unknown function (DUF5131)